MITENFDKQHCILNYTPQLLHTVHTHTLIHSIFCSCSSCSNTINYCVKNLTNIKMNRSQMWFGGGQGHNDCHHPSHSNTYSILCWIMRKKNKEVLVGWWQNKWQQKWLPSTAASGYHRYFTAPVTKINKQNFVFSWV